MRQNYEQLFTHLSPPEPPEGLFNKIMSRIRREQRLTIVKRRLVFLAVLLIGSMTALVPAWQTMRAGFIESGFINFVSLLFSDASAVLAYWQNFAWAVLESLPTMGMIMFLAAAFAFLESLKFIARDVKTFLTPINSNNHAL